MIITPIRMCDYSLFNIDLVLYCLNHGFEMRPSLPDVQLKPGPELTMDVSLGVAGDGWGVAGDGWGVGG